MFKLSARVGLATAICFGANGESPVRNVRHGRVMAVDVEADGTISNSDGVHLATGATTFPTEIKTFIDQPADEKKADEECHVCNKNKRGACGLNVFTMTNETGTFADAKGEMYYKSLAAGHPSELSSQVCDAVFEGIDMTAPFVVAASGKFCKMVESQVLAHMFWKQLHTEELQEERQEPGLQQQEQDEHALQSRRISSLGERDNVYFDDMLGCKSQGSRRRR